MCGLLKRPSGFFAKLLAALAILGAAPAAADVTVSFYSHPMGLTGGYLYFPHAFITVKGRIEGQDELVDRSYGFTAASVTPALLLAPTRGEIID